MLKDEFDWKDLPLVSLVCCSGGVSYQAESLISSELSHLLPYLLLCVYVGHTTSENLNGRLSVACNHCEK